MAHRHQPDLVAGQGLRHRRGSSLHQPRPEGPSGHREPGWSAADLRQPGHDRSSPAHSARLLIGLYDLSTESPGASRGFSLHGISLAEMTTVLTLRPMFRLGPQCVRLHRRYIMLCYKDMTFCDTKRNGCQNTNCHRHMDHTKTNRTGLPIALCDFSAKCPGYQPIVSLPIATEAVTLS